MKEEEKCKDCSFCEQDDGEPYCIMKDLYTTVDLEQNCDEIDIRGKKYFTKIKKSVDKIIKRC